MHKNYSIQYEFLFNGEVVSPGNYLKLKGVYELVQYECIMHDLNTDKDCLLVIVGKERRLYPMNRLKGVVSLKRSRKTCRKN